MSESPGYKHDGFCPVCARAATFVAGHSWYRDFLVCTHCGSVPRERAMATAIEGVLPNWRTVRIHESSPSNRGISRRMAEECPAYQATQYFPQWPTGEPHEGVRNENLERQTFADESFDLVVTLDVMEHVFDPGLVCREVSRTLRPNGYYIFTTPTYKEAVLSRQVARQTETGIEIDGEPMYHGNPVDPNGSLVTWLYGYDLAELIHAWSGLDVSVTRFHNHRLGIIGEHTEVYVCQKPDTLAV